MAAAKQTKDERLSLRINGKLKKKMLKYCDTHSTDMSDLVDQFFRRLVAREAERRKKERG